MRKNTRLEAIWVEVPVYDAGDRAGVLPAQKDAAAAAAGPAARLARDLDAAVAAGCRRALVWRALRAIAAFLQPPAGKRLCAGPVQPSPRATDAFLLALVREQGSIPVDRRARSAWRAVAHRG
jgi:hypothetical protein